LQRRQVTPMQLQAYDKRRQTSLPVACAAHWFYARFHTGAVAIAEGAAWGNNLQS